MEVKKLRTLFLDVFKTLNNMNPEYMKETFYKTAFTTHRPLNLVQLNMEIKLYGVWVLIFGTPFGDQIKKETDYIKFKKFINDCFGMKCKCNLCSFLA